MVCNLRILQISQHLFQKHSAVLARKVITHYCVVHQLLKFMEQETQFKIIHALIISNFGLGQPIFFELPLKSIWKLQLILNAMAWIVLKCTSVCPIWLVCENFTLTLGEIQCVDCTFKVLHGLGSGYLWDLLLPMVETMLHLRSSLLVQQIPSM